MDKQLRPSIFKRVLALFIDIIILGILGYISGLFLEDFYVSLGKYGSLLGSSVAIIYFSVLQSNLFYGQTFGKKAIGAKVTDLNGQNLTFGKSFMRSFIIFFPIMNVEMISDGSATLLIICLLALTFIASVYFIIVNKSRRSFHDIIVSSIVINENVTEFEINELNDRSNKKLIPIGIIATLIFGAGMYQNFSENGLSQLLTAKEKLEKLKGVISVNEIKLSTIYGSSDDPARKYSSLIIVIRIDDKDALSEQNPKYFDEFYKIARTEISEFQNIDDIKITLSYGYNIGIASKTQSLSKTFKQ